jgi:integrase
MIFLQDQGYTVPQTLLRICSLKQPDSLPRHLSDEQVRLLRDDSENRVISTSFASQQRDTLLDRAAFYLLWQSGLRKGEVEELRLEDLDLAGRKLSVRNGKGMKDRTVFLTDTTLRALQEYLVRCGQGPTDHVFLYRNQPLRKDLIHGRLKAAGNRVGVPVNAHRLRHTAATQLLNAGCPVTSIQKSLGHKKLNTTMMYARAHDQTVEADYFTAMHRVEQRLDLAAQK